MPNLKLGFLALLFLGLTACNGVRVIDFNVEEPAKVFHPPLPPPVQPVHQEPIVVTPRRAETWNKEIEAGERDDYVVYGYNAQDWLTMGQYSDRKDYYILRLLNIIKWYGHPDLQEKPPEKAEEE
jgi:hypothetical protein